MRRRRFLGAAGAVGGLVVAPAAGITGYVWVRSDRGNAGTLAFRTPLRIPPVAAATVDRDGCRRFRLTVAPGQSELLPGRPTATWGVNGPILGPTLRARRGDRVAVEVTNGLAEPTTMHWHGMHLPAAADGGPHQPIVPGATWRPEWTVEQRAATLWYHPHLHTTTARHVYRGVAGLFLIDDDEADRLPHEYGVDDVPLILQDRRFTGDNALDERDLPYGGLRITGLLGDTVLVNGTYDPHFTVRTTAVRLRLLNGANARVFNVGFTDRREVALVATDAGLLREPVRLTRVPLSPGERAEIVVSFRPGERATLRSFPGAIGGNLMVDRLAGGDDTLDLVRFVAVGTLRGTPPLPPVLSDAPPVPPITGPAFPITMGDFTLNGRTMDLNRVDRVARTGSVEPWDLTGTEWVPHNLHVHGAAFHVLAVDDRPPAPHLRGEKDTVYIPPSGKVRLAVRFLRHSDPTRPYMFHCHVLAHEDSGMMGQFLAVDPGVQVAAPVLPHPGHGQ